MSVSSPGPGGREWQYAKAEAWARPPGHLGLAACGNNKGSVSGPSGPALPAPHPASHSSQTASHSSQTGWWNPWRGPLSCGSGLGFNPGSVLLAACQEWVLNGLSLCFSSTTPTLAPAQGGPKTWMRQHMLSVSRAVKSCIHVGLFLLVLLCMCVCARVCAPSTTVSFQKAKGVNT